MNDTVGVLSAMGAIAVGTPILLAAIGETLTQRSGVMNLGIEGMMLAGAVVGFWAATVTGNVWLGVLAGAAAGSVLALVHAVLAVSLRVNQIISGLALVIVGTGFSSFLGSVGDSPLTGREVAARFTPLLGGGGLRSLPIVGPILFGQDLMVYLSWLMVAAASYYIFRSRPGLSMRAVGEDPAAADAAGISVGVVRYLHTVVGGLLAGLAGGYLAIEIIGTWQSGITSGQGWIAFALVIFSGWRPWRALFAAYVFGALTNLAFTLQIVGIRIPSDFLAMIPFILTIVALMLVSARPSSARKVSAPAALALPYSRESR